MGTELNEVGMPPRDCFAYVLHLLLRHLHFIGELQHEVLRFRRISILVVCFRQEIP